MSRSCGFAAICATTTTRGYAQHCRIAPSIAWREQKDQVIFEAPEIRTQQGNPFAVFTPYYNAWRARLGPGDMAAHDIDDVDSRLAPDGAQPMPSLEHIGFRRAELAVPAGM